MNERRESIRLSDWLAARTPRPPDALSARMAELLAGESCSSAELPSVLVAKAIAILATIGDDRASALQLLAADALITYAMEAAADSAAIDAIARSSMQKIAETIHP